MSLGQRHHRSVRGRRCLRQEVKVEKLVTCMPGVSRLKISSLRQEIKSATPLPLLTVVDNEVHDLEGEGWDNSLDINILWLVSLNHAFSHCTALHLLLATFLEDFPKNNS
jgi:hypothetical protein